MRTLHALPLLLVALLAGCPEPPPPGPGPGAPNNANAGNNDAGNNDAGNNDAGNHAAPDDPPAGGNNGGGDAVGGADLPDWELIPAAVRETVYPTLVPVSSWPDPAGLAEVGTSEKTKIDPSRITQLKQLVETLVAQRLQPKDMDAALGLDDGGRLFMRLGATKTVGSASMDLAPKDSKFPLFGIALDDPLAGEQTLANLNSRVKKALSKDLAKELEGLEDMDKLTAQPVNKGGERIAAMAMLDRQGFGMQFNYLYGYSNAERLLIVLQEVPHMSETGGD